MTRICLLVACGLLLLTTTSAPAVTIDWVTVGNPGNTGDVQSQGTFGAVSETYRISTYEVTNAQYTEFLNAVDPTGANSLSLYSASMNSDARGGITQNLSNAVGSRYEIKSGRDNNPVVYVSWYDTLRFANWLHNGQGAGDTETGAYTLLGGTATPSNGGTVTRNSGALFFLPSEDEWYKAAYHKNDGVTGNYWDYPTSTDATPYSDQPPGSDAPTQSNTANFRLDDGLVNGYNDGYTVTGSNTFVSSTNYLTDVGAYTLSLSPYGTFDQGGNVWEWNEAFISSTRAYRGGSWANDTGLLAESSRPNNSPSNENGIIGFRVASPFSEGPIVPVPKSITLGLIGAVLLMWRVRRGHRKPSL